MSALAKVPKSDKHSPVDDGPVAPVVVPEAPEDAVAPPAASGDFDSDLGSFAGAKAPPSTEPVVESAPVATASPSDPNSLAAMVLQRTAGEESSLPPMEDLAVPVQSGQAPDAAVAGDDAELLASMPVPASEPVAAAPGELVYDHSNAEAIVMQLLQGASLPQDEEGLRLKQDFFQAEAVVKAREDAHALKGKALMEEEVRRRELEQSGQIGGGGLVSLLSKLLSADPRSKLNRAIQNFKGDQEDLQRQRAKIAEEFRDRIYQVKSGHIARGMRDVHEKANSLSKAIRAYNVEFLNAENGKPFKEALLADAQDRGITVDEAFAEVVSGKAPQEVLNQLQLVKGDVLADDGVIAALKVMREKESEFFYSMSDSVKDREIMLRNFPDKFDASESYKDMMGTVDTIVKRMPDPIAEEEGRKKMRERMKEIADGIRAAFDAILNRVLAAVGAPSGPKA